MKKVDIDALIGKLERSARNDGLEAAARHHDEAAFVAYADADSARQAQDYRDAEYAVERAAQHILDAAAIRAMKETG